MSRLLAVLRLGAIIHAPDAILLATVRSLTLAVRTYLAHANAVCAS
jgi:hypothetical protein